MIIGLIQNSNTPPEIKVPYAMNGKNAVLFVSTFSFAALMMLFSFTSILLGLKNEMQLSSAQFGLLLSTFSITYAIMQIPSGILSDKYGGEIVLSVGLSVMGVATLGFSFSVSAQMALSLRTLAGLGGGLILPAAAKLLSDRFAGEELLRGMSIFGIGQGMGFVLTYTIGSGFVDVFDWRAASLFSFVLIAAAAILSLALPKRKENAPDHQQNRLSTAFHKKTLALLIIINFAALSVTSGVLQFGPDFLERNFQLSTSSGGWIIALMGIASTLAPYMSGVTAKRIGHDKVIITSMIMCTFCPLVLGISSSTIALALIFAATGLGTMLYFPPTFAQVPRTAKGEHAGKVFGIFNTVSFGASAIAPILFGYVLDSVKSYELGFACLSILAVLGLIASILLRRSWMS